ncbi:MAG: cell division protein FtsB [Gammaproteobacteria bacterium]|nr:MAG: cell division protein FtsB [Gammaproteobacteria bacterium]
MKVYAVLLLILLILLQYKLWFDEGGYFDNRRLEQQLQKMQAENEQLRERNRDLARKILLIKEDMNEIESYARRNLGMIKEGEKFIIVIDEKKKNHSLDSNKGNAGE